VTTYAEASRVDSSLALLTATDTRTMVEVQVEVKVRYRQKQRQGVVHLSRYTSMAVGTGFDPKELLFRNYLNLMDQSSRPQLRFAFKEGEKEVFTMGWLDPRGRLVATNTLQANDTAGVEGLTPALPAALEPGVWTVLAALTMLDETPRLVAKEKFVVMPSTPASSPAAPAPVVADGRLERFVTLEDRAQVPLATLAEAAVALQEFYTVPAWCEVVGEEGEGVCGGQACRETPWSSRFPDPKSTILGVDEEGRLV